MGYESIVSAVLLSIQYSDQTIVYCWGGGGRGKNTGGFNESHSTIDSIYHGVANTHIAQRVTSVVTN